MFHGPENPIIDVEFMQIFCIQKFRISSYIFQKISKLVWKTFSHGIRGHLRMSEPKFQFFKTYLRNVKSDDSLSLFGHFIIFKPFYSFYNISRLIFAFPDPQNPYFDVKYVTIQKSLKNPKFSDFLDISTIFSKPSRGTWLKNCPGIRDHLKMLWANFQLVSSYFRIKPKMHWTTWFTLCAF